MQKRTKLKRPRLEAAETMNSRRKRKELRGLAEMRRRGQRLSPKQTKEKGLRPEG